VTASLFLSPMIQRLRCWCTLLMRNYLRLTYGFVRNDIEAETRTRLLDPIPFQDLGSLVHDAHISEEASTNTGTSKKKTYAASGPSKKMSITTGTAMLVGQMVCQDLLLI
jgi:hypothetical protein